MWIGFVHLIARSWSAFTASLSTNTLGFFTQPIITILISTVTVIIIFRRRGRDGVKSHVREAITTSVIVTVTVGSLVYGSIFVSAVVRTIYEDHRGLVSEKHSLTAQKVNLETGNTDLQNKVTALKNAVTFLPIPGCMSWDQALQIASGLPVNSDDSWREQRVLIYYPSWLYGPERRRRQSCSNAFAGAVGLKGWNAKRFIGGLEQQGDPKGIFLISSTQSYSKDFDSLKTAFDKAGIAHRTGYARDNQEFKFLYEGIWVAHRNEPQGVMGAEPLIYIGAEK